MTHNPFDADRWRNIEALYEAARGLEPARRAAFLEENCAGDESLRQEVESLASHGENAGSFLRVPAPVRQPEAGHLVSHYEIQEKLGEGGLGIPSSAAAAPRTRAGPSFEWT